MADGELTTLRRLLTQAKPEQSQCPTPGPTKTSSNTLTITLVIWEAFNLDTLNASYGTYLDEKIPVSSLLQEVPRAAEYFADVELNGQEDIEQLIKWNDEVLYPTLEHAKGALGLGVGQGLMRDKIGSIGKPFRTQWVNEKGVANVHHLVAFHTTQLPYLVVGNIVPFNKFNPIRLGSRPHTATDMDLKPLRLLAESCHRLGTRYGYIQSENHLVACCFSKTGEKAMKARVRAIDWAVEGEQQLTSCLALWWLGMLALSSSESRELVNETEVVSINHWGEPRQVEDERGWVEIHHYSKVERRVDPTTPPAHQTQSPANMARFADVNGFHMTPDPEFLAQAAAANEEAARAIQAMQAMLDLANPHDLRH